MSEMTREALWEIRDLHIEDVESHKKSYIGGPWAEGILVREGKLIAALEEAWAERDELRKENLELLTFANWEWKAAGAHE